MGDISGDPSTRPLYGLRKDKSNMYHIYKIIRTNAVTGEAYGDELFVVRDKPVRPGSILLDPSPVLKGWFRVLEEVFSTC